MEKTKLMVSALLKNNGWSASVSTGEDSEASRSEVIETSRLGEGTKFGDTNNEKVGLQQSLDSPSSENTFKGKHRLDLVRKTIFRNFKRFYAAEFEEVFDYRKRRRNRGRFSQLILEKARAYFHKKFKEVDMQEAPSILIAMIDPKSKFCHSNTRYPDLPKQVNSLLRGFNIEKAERLMIIPEFSIMMLHFLKRESIISEMLGNRFDDHAELLKSHSELAKNNSSNNSGVEKSYELVIDQLKEQCYSYIQRSNTRN